MGSGVKQERNQQFDKGIRTYHFAEYMLHSLINKTQNTAMRRSYLQEKSYFLKNKVVKKR
jgi:hypothetical protein